MSTTPDHRAIPPETEDASLRNYVIGFGLSLGLTLTAYLLVVNHAWSARYLIVAVITLALVQFLVQLRFFLHLGREGQPRWKLFVFLFMVMVVVILVFGSLWIMNNLNYRMTPQQINTYMNNQGGGF
jgi:cytochrome o ubiquinol oxidase operon protein cyoD